MDRRQFLTATPSLGMIGSVRAATHTGTAPSNGLRIGGYDYDRVRPIMDGKVGIPGRQIQFEASDIYALTEAAFGPEQRYDVTEIGLIPFLRRYVNTGFRDYTLIPVFISRTFRHRNIFVRTDAGIETPEDLRGKTVGTPGYGFSAHTWIRGMLADEFGVYPDDMEWIETTESSDGARGSGELNRHFLPDDFPLIKGPPGVNESDLLVSGGCDALITAITPKAFQEGDPLVRQLFPDVKAAEQSYYRTSGVFPIMHAVAVRTELAEADPKLVTDLFRMYSMAKQMTYASLEDTTALRVTLPWVVEEVDETRALMGSNYWSYGIPANHKTLQTALRYANEQRLTEHLIDHLDLFHPLTHTLTE